MHSDAGRGKSTGNLPVQVTAMHSDTGSGKSTLIQRCIVMQEVVNLLSYMDCTVMQDVVYIQYSSGTSP